MKGENGSILILALCLCASLFLLASAIGICSISSIRKAVFMKDYQSALYVAEAGINQKLYELNQEPSDTNDIALTEPFGTGNGSYEVDYTAGLPAAITSTGRVKKRVRVVSIDIRDIAQAFNKHAIYGRNLNVNAQVTGNIYYDNAGIDTFSISGSDYTLTPVSQVDTTISFPSPNMVSYETSANHVYSDGDCTVHPGTHPPSGYNGNDDAYQFVSLPAGIIYIKDVVDDDVATGGDDDKPSVTLSSVNLAGSIIVEGDITLSGNCTITPASSDDPAIIADNVTLNAGNHNITGLIFANNSIAINGGTINGVIVSDTITITAGTFSYNGNSYKQNNNPVYKYFTGGQRAYIPGIDSWKEE